MNEKQALEVLVQGINIALGNGAFKNTKDVAIINTAMETLTQFVIGSEETEVVEAEVVRGPKKAK